MKTTLELPDELMREVKVRAAREGRKMKDIVEAALRRDLGLSGDAESLSLRDFQPVSVGRVIEGELSEDRMEEMLDDRGHRY